MAAETPPETVDEAAEAQAAGRSERSHELARSVRKPMRVDWRNGEWVALRRFKVSADDWIEPGEVVEPVRRFVIMHWFRQNRIGPADHPWTSFMIDLFQRREEQRERRHQLARRSLEETRDQLLADAMTTSGAGEAEPAPPA